MNRLFHAPARWLQRVLVMSALGLLAAGLLAAAPAAAQDLLSEFEDKVTTFTLDNGLNFVIVERHDAPVVSFNTYADVGSVDEPLGQTGLAHMFEHMAFKGTTSIGTTDIQAEVNALQSEEEAYLALRRERAKGPQADSTRIQELMEEFSRAKEEAKQFVQQNEFDRLLQEQGMTGLNASTSADATRYFYSLPANKAELFFALESDRFLNPVLREYYVERDVVIEERRMRTESSPIGRLVEETLSIAFKAHPYGNPTIGHASDLVNISRTEAEQFFETYYGANNLTIAIVGDVDPDQMRAYAEKYFSRLPEGAKPPRITTQEPDQIGERRVTIIEDTQPFVLMGYHRPGQYSGDDAAYAVLQDILSAGRTSRLYKSLVETEKALQVQSIAAFPGDKYATLFALFAVPNQGVSPDSLEQDIYAVIDRIKEEGVTQEEVERAKTRARASLVNSLSSNTGLAFQFSEVQALTGDWRNVFRRLEQIEAVTAEDVQRIAQDTFMQSNRTVGMIKSAADDGEPTAAN